MKLQESPKQPVQQKPQENAAPEQEQGRSMTPPGFQLTAQDGAGSGAVQAKMPEGKELPSQEGGSKVAQRQEAPGGQQVMATGTPADPVWEDFAGKFNKEFKSVLHVFDPEQMANYPGTVPTTEGTEAEAASPKKAQFVDKGEQSGAVLTGEQLKALFTEKQRSQLNDFMDTRVVPERIFNGDEPNKTTAQQRLLMAGQILATGKYAPGSFEQKVHARMCWHWVHITHHYAGATPGGALNQGMMGMFDHDNNVVLGSGKMESIFHGKGVKPEDLPAEYDNAEHIGPIPEGSDHKTALEKEQKAKQEDPTKKGSIKMLKTMPFDDLAKLQPGDWLWYYNANGSGIGSHSVIFSRWASDVQERGGVKFRKAICFSQGKPENGGREHTANLGERFLKDGDFQINPVNYVTRVSADASPADTVEELLPKSAEKKEAALVSGNEKFIGKAEKHFNKPVDREKVKEWLREKNTGLMERLDGRLSEGQRKLLDAANASDEIETLVRLYQRLAKIVTNADILAKNQESTNEKKDAEYEKVSEKVHAEESKINDEIHRLDDEKSDLEAKLAELNAKRDELDTAPEVKSKKREAKTLSDQLKVMEGKHKKEKDYKTTNAEYLEKKAKRDALNGEVTNLTATGVANKKEIETVKAEIAKRKKRLGAIPYLRKKETEKWSKAHKQLPFSLVHPGSWKGEAKGGTTGKLEDVIKVAQFESLLGEGELPKPEVKVKPKGKRK